MPTVREFKKIVNIIMGIFIGARVNVTLSQYSTMLHLTTPECVDYVAMPCKF